MDSIFALQNAMHVQSANACLEQTFHDGLTRDLYLAYAQQRDLNNSANCNDAQARCALFRTKFVTGACGQTRLNSGFNSFSHLG